MGIPLLFSAIGFWVAIGTGAGQVNRIAPLTQRLEVPHLGCSVRYPAGWSAGEEAGVRWLLNVPVERQKAMAVADLDLAAQIFITTERRRDHVDAVRRLRDIQAETDSPSTFLNIGGWPALQRSYVGAREQPGDQDKDDRPQKLMHVTTVIAAGNHLIRLEGRLPPDAPALMVAQVKAIGASTAFRSAGLASQVDREIQSLRSRPHPGPAPAPPPQTPRGGGVVKPLALRAPASAIVAPLPNTPGVMVEAPGLAQRLTLGNPASEPEIAVSTNGRNIVVAQQFQYSVSNNGGLTFSSRSFSPPATGGDASVAYGRSGSFYAATINGSSTSFNVLPNNGTTFISRTNAFTCGTTTGTPTFCRFPDQEHIAADRFNAATAGGDQVYSTWRQLNGTYGIVCSRDGGQTWDALTASTFTTGDLPRITVGQDGFVYVVYQNVNTVMLNKYSSCNSGLAVQAPVFPLVVATLGPNNYVACPVAGLDRCNNGNNLSSFTVAVDDTNANHVYVAYAQNTSTTPPISENIVIRDSTDGGATWSAARAVTVSSAASARRFLPWLCSVGGAAYASWYDRRAITAANNDLTDYYAASASVSAGNLIPGAEFQVSAPGSADPQCASGWPCGAPRAAGDSQSCSVQPQAAGLTCKKPSPDSNNACGAVGNSPCTAPETCQGGTCKKTPPDSNRACDTLGTACPAGETCQGLGVGGCPKYGDYNGNACAAGRLYNVWASATPPPGTAPSGQIDLYFAAKVVCCTPQIQVPASISFPSTCAGSTAVAAVNICNTGKADLNVNPITSSNPQFLVPTPSSGYPVTIQAGSCFPFQVTFAPTGSGLQTGTLTVPSDDPVNPTVTIPVKGIAGTSSIATLIANTGDFGETCPGTFRDLPLTINNNGACNLVVSAINSSSTDFHSATVVSFPLTIAPGTSLQVPMRFEPSSPGAKAGNITINSNDPLRPTAVVPVQGMGGHPTIATVVADNGDFGSVCAGRFKDLMVTINNTGTCTLNISNISSTSPEFQTAQVLSFPLTVAPGASIQVPIRYAPTIAGDKTATITLSSNDPASPTKTVSLKAHTDPEYICHPPKYAALGMAIGPTFGPSRTGDYTFSGKARFLAPLTRRGTFSVQSEGEYTYYPGRQEGQFDAGLLDRVRHWQAGLFGDFKYVNFNTFRNGGSLGEASFTVDYLFHRARLGIFATKGFRDNAAIARPPLATTLLKIVDQVGVSGQVRIIGGTYLEGDIEYLRRHAPGLNDRAGFDLRVIHPFSSQIAVTADVGFNETFVGHSDSGRVVFGVQFGHFVRPRDFVDRRHPLGTTVPRMHYELIH